MLCSGNMKKILKGGLKCTSLQAWFCVLSALMILTLSGCVESDPRYPAYYRYIVDLKVDGKPVRVERVIKCTGTLVTGSSYAPGVKTGRTYLSPPIVGAYVPGSDEAVYVPVISACRWASATSEEREEDAKNQARVLDPPFTDQNEYLPPSSMLPVLWVSDDQTFDKMEYYVSGRALSGIDSRVEFLRAYPPEIVGEVEFKSSEKRAVAASPDLTPFFRPEDRRLAEETSLYKKRFRKQFSGVVYPECFAAWRVPRSEWSQVPGLEEWVASLPSDGRAYRIAVPNWGAFTDMLDGIRDTPGLVPVEPEPGVGIDRFETFDAINPAISTDQGTYVDLQRQGFMGCEFLLIQPNRVEANEPFKIDHSSEPTPSFRYEIAGERLYARFLPTYAPVYVRELDEFLVFQNKIISATSGDPVAKGWKE